MAKGEDLEALAVRLQGRLAADAADEIALRDGPAEDDPDRLRFAMNHVSRHTASPVSVRAFGGMCPNGPACPKLAVADALLALAEYRRDLENLDAGGLRKTLAACAQIEEGLAAWRAAVGESNQRALRLGRERGAMAPLFTVNRLPDLVAKAGARALALALALGEVNASLGGQYAYPGRQVPASGRPKNFGLRDVIQRLGPGFSQLEIADLVGFEGTRDEKQERVRQYLQGIAD